MASGVKGLMLASLGFSEVESHSRNLDLEAGKEARLEPSSSNSNLDLRLKDLGADLGEVMAHAVLGDPRPSHNLIALMVCEGGEGELKGLSAPEYCIWN